MRAENAALDPVLEPLSREIQEIHRSILPAGNLSPAQERAWLDEFAKQPNRLPVMLEARREELAAEIERLTADARARVRARALAMITPEHVELSGVIESLGGKVTDRLIGQSALVAEVPLGALQRLAADNRVHRIFENPDPKPCLDVSVPYLGVPSTFWAANISGQTWDVGLIDTGCLQNHPCFSGITFDTAPGVGVGDAASGHGTSVASIICSGDLTHRGVAPGIDRLIVGTLGSAISHSDWMVTTAADDPEVMNHSWGTGIANSDDTAIEQFYDALADDFNCAMVFAAGNDGESGNSSTLTRPSSARNVISVGNMFIFNTLDPADDRLMDTSGQGPVPGLNRRKPDLVAPGEATQAANSSWMSLPDFDYFGGTSAAAPHVSGGYVLVVQARGDQTPYANKAVLINAADAWSESGTNSNFLDDEPFSGSLWNNAYGWGTLNLANAFFNATDVFEQSVSTLPGGTTDRFYSGTLFRGEKATLVWHRSMIYNGTMVPPNITPLADLDLRLYRQSDGALIDTSLSSVDNVEQVGINAPPSPGDLGTPVVIKVTLDTVNVSVPYALATEENFVSGAPVLTTSLVTTQATGSTPFNLIIAVTNNGAAPAQSVITTLDPAPPGWTFSSTVSNVGVVPAGERRYASFLVFPPCDTNGGSANISWVSSSSSYGEQFVDTGAGVMTLTTSSVLANDAPQLVILPTGSTTRRFNTVANEFHVVASRPGGSDWTLFLAPGQECIALAPQVYVSGLPGDEIDFIVVNSNNPAVPDVGTNYVGLGVAAIESVFANSRVELDIGFDFAGSTVTTAFNAEEVVEVFEKSLASGVRYTATVEVLSGSSDIAFRVYPPSTTYANPVLSVLAASDAGGLGGTESLTFVAPAAGMHGFVVTKKNLGTSDIRLTVTCGADFNADGVVNVADIFAFLSAWFASAPGSDFNGDTVRDVSDIFAFLSAWFAGCP